MYIKKLELTNFRNYDSLFIEFDKFVNIFYGDNAQGKTNILESIYIGGTTKSHRSNKDKEIIKFNKDESHIRIELIKNDIPYKIDMHLRKNKTKVIAINGLQIRKAAELLGILNLVFFSPEDLSIIKSGPSIRRKFIDMELSQLDHYYLHNLSNYNKAVNQRNKLLKEMYNDNNLIGLLEVYDEQLIKYGSLIINRRREFINELNIIINKIHSQISGNSENCVLEYLPDVQENNYREILLLSRNNDIKYKITSKGPHKDDLLFKINDIDVRKFGSQGQQRTAALSLKLSEIELVKKSINDTPVLLLDDVLSELDSKRQNYLINSIGDIQTMITCTGLDDFIDNRLTINKVFKVISGEITGEEL